MKEPSSDANTPAADFRSVRRVRGAFANAAFYRVISQIVGAIIYVLLVRIVSEYDYGVYTLFYSIPAVMGAVLSLGIGSTLLRFLPEYFAKHDFALVRHFVRWCLRLRLITNILFFSICLLLWDYIAPIFGVAGLKSYFLLFIAITLTHFQCRILTMAISANLMQKWSSGLSTAFAVFKLIGYCAAIYVGVSLVVILVADLVAYLLWYAGLRFAYHAKIPTTSHDTEVKFSPEERKRVVRYAAFYNFNDVGVVALNSTTDRLFIAAFMTPIGVGAYAFCTGLNAMIQKLMPVSFFNGVIEPLVFTLDYGSQRARAREYFQFLVKINYLVQFPALALVSAIPTQIIHIVFAGKFIEYQYLLIAAFAFPATYAFLVPTTIMAQLGEKAGIILASKIFAVYNIVAAVILIPLFGVYGAIVATGTAQLFKSIFIWYFVRDVASFRGTGLFFMTQVVMWSSCWLAIKYVTSDMADLWGLISAIAIVGVFAVIGLRFAHFNRRESDLIRKALGNRATRILEYAGVIAK